MSEKEKADIIRNQINHNGHESTRMVSDLQNKVKQLEDQLSETHKNLLEEKKKTSKVEKDKREYEKQVYEEKEHRLGLENRVNKLLDETDKVKASKGESDHRIRELTMKLHHNELSEQELKDELECEKKRLETYQSEMRA